MNQLKSAAVFAARVVIGCWFLPAGIEKITSYAGTAAYMSAHSVPGALLPLVILTEVGGAILILIGWRTRLAAFLLTGFTFLAVLLFHFPATGGTDKIIQMAELVDAAGLLILAAHGAGGWSIDARLARRRANGLPASRVSGRTLGTESNA